METIKITRIPLKQWYEDMNQIVGSWNGEDSAFRDHTGKMRYEEDAHLANETAELIVKLEQKLNELNY